MYSLSPLFTAVPASPLSLSPEPDGYPVSPTEAPRVEFRVVSMQPGRECKANRAVKL